MAIFLPNMPYTEEGAKAELSPELEENCRVIYRKTDDGEGFLFAGFWSPSYKPNEQNSCDEIILPFKSVYDGKVKFDAGTAFSNVIGSTSDLKEDKLYWLKLLEKNKIDTSNCATDGRMYRAGAIRDTSELVPMCTKNRNNIPSRGLVGAHIILGKESKRIDRHSTVYMLTLCRSHNGRDKTFMKIEKTQCVAVLRNYFPRKTVETAIRELKAQRGTEADHTTESD